MTLSAPRYAISLLAVGGAYFAAAAISLLVALPPGYASSVWPPAGIALAAWLVLGGRIWPAIFIGAAVANFSVGNTPPLLALAIAAGNTAEAAIAASLVQRLIAGLRHRFSRPEQVWKFVAIAMLASLVAATNAVAALALAGRVPWQEFGMQWLTWWLGDSVGIILVTPLVLCWLEPIAARPQAVRGAEYAGAAALILLCAAAIIVGDQMANVPLYMTGFLMIPFIAWIASRLEQRAVTLASFAIATIAVIDLLDGSPSFFFDNSLHVQWALLYSQLVVGGIAIAGLVLSAVSTELSLSNAQLKASHDELDQRVQERTGELERAAAQLRLLSQRLVEIQDDERRRLAAELHDTVCSDLSALTTTLHLIGRDLPRESHARVAPRIDDALAIANDAAQATRNVMGELHPPAMEELGLTAALLSHAEKFESRTGIPVSFRAEPSNVKLPSRVQDALFRISLEALHNVSKHAAARAVRVTLESRANRLVLGIDDDGSGFDPAASVRRGESGGWGLMIMKERARAIGGELRLHSAPGEGTRIEVRVPPGD